MQLGRHVIFRVLDPDVHAQGIQEKMSFRQREPGLFLQYPPVYGQPNGQ